MTPEPKMKREAIWKWALEIHALDEEDGTLVDFPFGARPLYAAVQRDQIVVYAIVDPLEQEILQRRVYVVGNGNPIRFDTTAKIPLGVVPLLHGALMFHVFVGGYDPNEFMAIYGKRNNVDMFARKE